MTDHDESAPMLPGLEPPARTLSELELAARRSIASLHSFGLLDERHALTCQLVLDLAAAVAAGSRSGRASAAAMAAAQLLAAWESLPEPIVEGGDGWDELVNDLRAAAARHAAEQPAE